MLYQCQNHPRHPQTNSAPSNMEPQKRPGRTLSISERNRRQHARDVTLGKNERRTPIRVTLSTAPSTYEVVKKVFGHALQKLPNDYANVRMALGFLLLGMNNQTDFRLKAVRPYPSHFSRWLAMGSQSQTAADVVENSPLPVYRA